MRRIPQPVEVLIAACSIVGVDPASVAHPTGRTRTKAGQLARRIYCGVIRERFASHYGYHEIAHVAGCKSHSSAIDSVQAWNAMDDGYELAPGLTKADARRSVLRLIGIAEVKP